MSAPAYDTTLHCLGNVVDITTSYLKCVYKQVDLILPSVLTLMVVSTCLRHPF